MFQFIYLFFFFKQKTAYEMRISDWSSDVCSSDLAALVARVERLLDVADIKSDPLRFAEQGAGAVDLALQLLERRDRQARQVACLVRERRRLILQLLDLIVDLLERARGGQDVLGVIAGIVDDPAHPGRGRDRHCRRSEEHTSELQSLMRISYAVFRLKKKNARTHK